MDIREIKATDVAAVVEIYNYYVESTSISFEEDPITTDNMAQRIDKVINTGLPWIVAEIEGKVVGYAYASKWKPRSAYRFTVEPSVYIKQGVTGKGIGKALYLRLLSILAKKGFKNAIGVIALPNPPSIGLHESLGFQKVGEFSNIGFKFGQKKSVGYWQLELNA
ncbi:N-acetyltransferase family protein [Vibrio parahaemolyticus]|uniref:GNAT family N-acetyltransferase n=1 Tax=Vibrio parahaemolyticus TaxID=670 RepID=UPI001D16A78E|nr:GNAT family N-acetyltransferase [Vibrio parahaemolyticus]MCC3859521.1 N-acetyltransferase family protein [Vibrio parahaemolyticus]